MKQRGRIGAILLIALVSLVMIGGIVFLVNVIFNKGGVPRKEAKETVNLLTNPTANTKIEMIARGPVIAEEKHYEIVITITENSRKLVIYRGYERKQEYKKVELGNNSAAFHEFLRALDQNDFAKKQGKDLASTSVCAGGNLVIFKIMDGDKVVHSTYTSDCKGSTNMAGKDKAITDFIMNQIDGGKDLINKSRAEISNPKEQK